MSISQKIIKIILYKQYYILPQELCIFLINVNVSCKLIVLFFLVLMT